MFQKINLSSTVIYQINPLENYKNDPYTYSNPAQFVLEEINDEWLIVKITSKLGDL
jgi:hypothetical protein